MTKSKNLVHISVNQPGDQICVDIFERPDGSFGFEEYRRDIEDPSGWFPIGGHGHFRFENFEAAKIAADERVGWFGGA